MPLSTERDDFENRRERRVAMNRLSPDQADLRACGLSNLRATHWNLTEGQLYEEAIRRGEGTIAAGGAFAVTTGEHTGRSPNDKFIVDHASYRGDVDWGKVNRPIAAEAFDILHQRAAAYLQGREVFVQDCYAGADPAFRLPIRVITETAWHNLFARNMFIQPPAAELAGFEPGFTIIQVPGLEARGAEDASIGTFVLVDFERRLVLIGGTWYAGEIKKSVFGILNFLLPAQGVLPMHCSANVGAGGDAAIFFGLSGTGKTTLSADGTRTLIGDDEHGWGENGIFNFEGGCYAKVINLSAEAEPEIYATTGRFGTVLENVVVDPVTRRLDLDDNRYTENTRASYPIDFIPNTSATGTCDHPRNIVMLTADAFGVLPPISRLTPEQAMYHFLSGYSACRGHRERPRQQPTTFSTCFGAPFMPCRASGEMLRDKMAKHQTTCWLVNTGWSVVRRRRWRTHENRLYPGDGAGRGRSWTARCVRTIISDCWYQPPGGRADHVLDPRTAWQDKGAYD